MLQQTQVKTALPYYERWMRALPSWRSLDHAPIDRVLKLWEGLGYYRRARNLKAAARMVMEEYDGTLPENEEQILRLPGVGPYSAGAILSIAFNRPTPVVDGNVIRVFSRIFAIRGDLKSGPGHKKLWRLAEHLIHGQRPGDYNQALMELGAMVCLPEKPNCPSCPLRHLCRASKTGEMDAYPTRKLSPRILKVFMAAAFIEKDGKVLLQRRTMDARWWQGLWELPSAEGGNPADARIRLEKDLGVSLKPQAIARISHQVTNHKISLQCYRGAAPTCSSNRSIAWVNPALNNTHPLSSAHKKLLKKLSAR